MSTRLLLRNRLSFTLLCLLFSLAASAQQTPRQTLRTSQLKPLPLPDLYRAFLLYQNFLDTRSAALISQEKNEIWLRNDLQNRLRFSDAEYAPIRTSSERLATEWKALDQQESAIRKSWSASSSRELRAIAAQRKSDVENEIYALGHELSSQNKTALENFMTDFFAPKAIPDLRASAQSAKAAQQGVKP